MDDVIDAIQVVLGVLICAILIFLCVATPIVVYSWMKSGREAQFINKQYNTNYTQSDMFWNDELVKQQLSTKQGVVDKRVAIKQEK